MVGVDGALPVAAPTKMGTDAAATSTSNLEPAVWLPAVRAGTGADGFTGRLAEALTKRGIRCQIAWLPHRAEFAPWTVRRPSPPPWANIAHVNSWLHDRFIPRDLPVVTTLHACVHDPALRPYKSMAQRLYHWGWVRRLELNALRRSSIVTAVSGYTATAARRALGRQDIAMIHNWIDADAFSPDDRQVPNQPFRLLYVGKLSHRKGADLLPDVMRALGDDFVLHYTGSPGEIGASPPGNMVATGILGCVDDMVAAYRGADALLFPTRLEGLSLAVLEAQACGLPVVGFDCSSMPEAVVRDRTGILCRLDDTQGLIEAIRLLAGDAARWSLMRQAARRHAVREFGEDKAIDSYLALYRLLLRDTAGSL